MPEYPQYGLRQIDPRSRIPMQKEYPAYEGRTGEVYDTGESVYTPIYQPRETYDPMYIDSTQGPMLQEASGLRQQEPNVPEWATSKGRFGEYGPTVYGGLGAIHEAMGGRSALGPMLGQPAQQLSDEDMMRMGMGLTGSIFPKGGLGAMFGKAAPVAKSRITVTQHPSGSWGAHMGEFGAPGSGWVTQGATPEEVMKRARQMFPSSTHDIGIVRKTEPSQYSRAELVDELKRRRQTK